MRIAHGVTTLSALALVAVGGCATVEGLYGKSSSDIPFILRPPTSESRILEVQGAGVQIYTCSQKAGQVATYEWTLSAPDAQLKDASGHVVGRHFAGPTWQFDDGSTVIADVTARVDSPTKSIPWLLLTTRRTTGSGKLAATGSVLRLHTVGGVAPAEGCDAANAGKEVRVPYSATYEFYGTRL